ncbi:uncharacterized protein [Prorops nasuta]|uniref:uncharacterized protein n=1 Tax=Prorops nasuta TaxID=863751 RepID=UPI0034CDA19B
MHTIATISALLAVLVVVSGQQYQQQGAAGYADDYADYEAAAPRPAHPTPRSYSNEQAPSQRQTANAPKPTAPVAILKQINRHNEDGSYTYGFEGADGSFKIETKLPTGDVKGKYGFVDDTGKVRVVEYGANQYGFQPAGDGITVAPPTLVDETTNKESLPAQNYPDYDYQQQQQQQPQPPAPARSAVPLRQQQSHTHALYAAEEPRSLEKQPIFAPAAQPQSQLPPQSPLYRQAYDEPAPPSQAYNQGPAQFSPAPVQEPRAQPQTRSQSAATAAAGGGILDQLARDYALPQGVAPPLHDISFGYY